MGIMIRTIIMIDDIASVYIHKYMYTGGQGVGRKHRSVRQTTSWKAIESKVLVIEELVLNCVANFPATWKGVDHHRTATIPGTLGMPRHAGKEPPTSRGTLKVAKASRRPSNPS